MTDTLALLRHDWQCSLRSRNLADTTQRVYDTAARQFSDWSEGTKGAHGSKPAARNASRRRR